MYSSTRRAARTRARLCKGGDAAQPFAKDTTLQVRPSGQGSAAGGVTARDPEGPQCSCRSQWRTLPYRAVPCGIVSRAQKRTLAHTHWHAHSCTPTRTRTNTHTRAHTCTRTRTHACTRARARTHAHTRKVYLASKELLNLPDERYASIATRVCQDPRQCVRVCRRVCA